MLPSESTEMSGEVEEEYKRFIGRKIFFITSLFILIVLLLGIGVTLGPIKYSVLEVYTTILHRFFPDYFNVPALATTIVWNIRLPRVLFGIVAGIGLAIAGCVLQGILKNPLASPYTLGIAHGAGFGASIAIVFGAGFVGGQYLIIGNAFIFSLIPAFFIFGIARYKRATPETMILGGIAMMYLFSAAITLVQYFAEVEAVKAVVFWMVGDLGRGTWSKLFPVSIVLGCCIPLLVLKSWDINVISAGDESAKSLGVNVERIRIFSLILASLLTSTIVCFTGAIGFIGLVAPHIARMVIGGDNRFLIPASGLVGAVLLVVADIVSMQIIAPAILPVGVVTAFMGVPLFIYLIIRERRVYW
jgi:iron complex transport system permease protein